MLRNRQSIPGPIHPIKLEMFSNKLTIYLVDLVLSVCRPCLNMQPFHIIPHSTNIFQNLTCSLWNHIVPPIMVLCMHPFDPKVIFICTNMPHNFPYCCLVPSSNVLETKPFIILVYAYLIPIHIPTFNGNICFFLSKIRIY